MTKTPTAVESAQAENALAFTGGSSWTAAVAALGLVVLGAVLLLLKRRS